MYNQIKQTYIRGVTMALSYNRLWKLLIDKKISRGEFTELSELPSGTMTKLRNNIPVHLKVIEKICDKLECKIEDVVEIKTEDVN
jgi:DNA (cytosine-5)-methyltransferase 1